jgi:hypothetical protein
MGSSVAGYNSIYEQFLVFKLKWQTDQKRASSSSDAASSAASSASSSAAASAPAPASAAPPFSPPPLFVATVDVKQCFDTIERDRLLQILDKVILEV